MMDNTLQVPGLERNFLISPPGSPREDWRQTQEGEPSKGGHHRIGHLETPEQLSEVTLTFKNESIDLPSIVIEDFDANMSSKYIPVTSIPPT